LFSVVLLSGTFCSFARAESEDIGPSFSATIPIAFDVPEDTNDLIMVPYEIREDELYETNPIVLLMDI